MRAHKRAHKSTLLPVFEWAACILVLIFVGRQLRSSDVALPTSSKKLEDPPKDDAASKIKRELLVTEYEHCLERYENLYKALWQNLSYLSVLSAAIVTFASAKFDWHLVALVAGAPLLFWYLAQFRPLDMYGRIARARTAEIERILNSLHFDPIETRMIGDKVVQVKLDHWIRFGGGESTKFSLGWLFFGLFRVLFKNDAGPPVPPVAVRTRMQIVFGLMMIAWFGVLGHATWNMHYHGLKLVKGAGQELTLKPGDAEVKVEITPKR